MEEYLALVTDRLKKDTNLALSLKNDKGLHLSILMYSSVLVLYV